MKSSTRTIQKPWTCLTDRTSSTQHLTSRTEPAKLRTFPSRDPGSDLDGNVVAPARPSRVELFRPHRQLGMFVRAPAASNGSAFRSGRPSHAVKPPKHRSFSTVNTT